MDTTRIASLLLLLPALLFVSCGGDDEPSPSEQEFLLADVRAEELRNVGMGIEMTGDTVGMDMPEGARVYSPDSSKVAYCDKKKLYIEDADGETSRVLHEMTDQSDVRACFGLKWGATGRELSFTQARETAPGTLQLMTVTITLGNGSEDE